MFSVLTCINILEAGVFVWSVWGLHWSVWRLRSPCYTGAYWSVLWESVCCTLCWSGSLKCAVFFTEANVCAIMFEGCLNFFCLHIFPNFCLALATCYFTLSVLYKLQIPEHVWAIIMERHYPKYTKTTAKDYFHYQLMCQLFVSVMIWLFNLDLFYFPAQGVYVYLHKLQQKRLFLCSSLCCNVP